MEPATVISELWRRTQARDWAGVGELIAQDAVIEWPVSSERISGRANYVAVNSEYPEGWSIRVKSRTPSSASSGRRRSGP
jgi:hypothetical protein